MVCLAANLMGTVKQVIFDQIETINQTWAVDRNCEGLMNYFHEDYILMFQGGDRANGIDEAIEGYLPDPHIHTLVVGCKTDFGSF